MPITLSNLCRRPAMNTLFEIIVGDDDLENAMAAAEAALDEITRIESVLSRFDPASEVSRVNREAARQPVLVSHELCEILVRCKRFWESTGGYFDITAGSGFADERRGFDAIQFDAETRRIAFSGPDMCLDFGAFGKGYALDCAAEILQQNGIRNAVLHGGTSSVLAFGDAARIGVKNPWSESEELRVLSLENAGLSTSATFHPGNAESDIINPQERTKLRHDAACVVMASSAAEAEVFSTALLCMGKSRAAQFCEEKLSRDFQVFWIDKPESEARFQKIL